MGDPGTINADNDGKIISASSVAKRLFGWPDESVIGMPLSQLLPQLPDWRSQLHLDTPPFYTHGVCRDGAKLDVRVALCSWIFRDRRFVTLTVDKLNPAEGYTASLMEDIGLVQEVALWAGLPAVIERAAGWFERAHPGSLMWLRVKDAEGEHHVAASPRLPASVVAALKAIPTACLQSIWASGNTPFTPFESKSNWPESLRRPALKHGIRYGGIRPIGLSPERQVGVLVILCPRDPLGAQQLHALDKATELVLLAAELGQTERRLRETRGAFNALLNAAVDAIVVIDDQGIIVTFNTAAERIFGYAAGEMLGRNVSILLPSVHGHRHDDYIRSYLIHRKPRIIGLGGREIAARRRDGTLFPVELAVGEVRLEGASRFVGIVRDISARKNQERVIQQQQEELRLTLDSAPIGMTTIDAAGHFLSANRALTDWLGYSEPEILSMSLAEVVCPGDADACFRYVSQAFAGTLENPRLRARLVHKNGKLLIAVIHSGLIRDSDHNPLRLVTQIEDITERVQLETEARHHQERLTHLNRLSMLGEMAAGIAHEINQPLTAIASYTQACQRRIEAGTSDREKALSILEKVSAQALRAGSVIRRMRSLVKDQKSSQIPTDINKIVTESVSVAKIDTRLRDCRLTTQLDPLLPPVLADPVQIQQILLNLIGNAVDAMESVPVEERRILVTASRTGSGDVETTVADHGEGFSEEVAEQLFSPFFTTKARGMGMGLSISRSIIAAHGGRLWFSLNPTDGTVFHFTLSAVED